MPIDANPLKTIVYQSYRTHDVADWLQRCMRSTQSWAAAQGFDYRFIDDRFFDCIPDWYRRGAGGNLQVLANLARIVVAEELLGAGCDRTIWIDADAPVFNPQSFKIDVSSEFAFCREVWMIYAANLAASLRGATLNGVTLADSHFDFIVDVLDRDRGATFNDVFAA